MNGFGIEGTEQRTPRELARDAYVEHTLDGFAESIDAAYDTLQEQGIEASDSMGFLSVTVASFFTEALSTIESATRATLEDESYLQSVREALVRPELPVVVGYDASTGEFRELDLNDSGLTNLLGSDVLSVLGSAQEAVEPTPEQLEAQHRFDETLAELKDGLSKYDAFIDQVVSISEEEGVSAETFFFSPDRVARAIQGAYGSIEAYAQEGRTPREAILSTSVSLRLATSLLPLERIANSALGLDNLSPQSQEIIGGFVANYARTAITLVGVAAGEELSRFEDEMDSYKAIVGESAPEVPEDASPLQE